ncbi:MAG: hypothetical protein M1337_03645 [Actinobacteria bacterium]|nr:hypothetical protein [Actinomycetota bacterium]MCL5025726.1 hypothetical protein [Chloroflexota bacterium]
MNRRVADEILWRYVDILHYGSDNAERCLSLFPKHRDQLEPLLHLAKRLGPSLAPVRPSPAFARRLKEELLVAAASRSRAAPPPASHQELWWRAAAVGSAVSVMAAFAVMWHNHNHTQEAGVGARSAGPRSGGQQHAA